MAKNVKLTSNKKNEADGRFYVNSGFFRRYKCTSAGAVIVWIGEIISLVLTTILALVLGIGGAAVTMQEGSERTMSNIAGYVQSAVVLWLISSAVYVVGTFLLIGGFARIACAVHSAAVIMNIVMYYLFDLASETANVDSMGPTVLYMPCIAIMVISVVVAMVVHIPLWLDKKADLDKEVAPSILVDEED